MAKIKTIILANVAKEDLVAELKRRIAAETQAQYSALFSDDVTTTKTTAPTVNTGKPAHRSNGKGKKNPAVAGSMKKLWAAAHKAGFSDLGSYKAYRAKQQKAKAAKGTKASKPAQKAAKAPAKATNKTTKKAVQEAQSAA
ncbi:MAG TPA: hypothetical protein VHZ09_19360 [Acidobacteriaceae bacterium]|jgi:hypothetical protein|nr:hypothetical protein [Acidobacteriaceae bacterium]